MLEENLAKKQILQNYQSPLIHSFDSTTLKETFRKNGFIQYKASDIDIDSKILISREFKALEEDPFAPPNTQRFRRYGNALILPWEKHIEPIWLPTVLSDKGQELSGYDQGNNNPEHGSIRYFNALSRNVKFSHYLNKLIVEDYKLTFGLNEYYLPIYVGVHFVKLTSNNQSLGISSPDCFHQDGEPFTFAHLFYRSNNITGGENYIANPNERNKRLDDVNVEQIYSQFTLKNILDSFAVHDTSVCHYVSPIKKIQNDQLNFLGERWVILIDYSLTKQKI